MKRADDPREIAKGLTKAQRALVLVMPVVRGKRNGQFWAHNDANLLADLSHLGLCKMPFADRWGACDWQFVSRIKREGQQVRAILENEQ